MVATVAAGTTAEYYLKLTAYYTGGHEPQGRWLHVGFRAGFEPGAPVGAAAFQRLHSALDRQNRPMLANKGGKLERVGGYDVTFSAPKSVSILFGLADEPLRARLEQAQARAVASAMVMLERNAAFTRSGKGGLRRDKAALTVATFQHGESRPEEHQDGLVFADPSLHTHAIILNVAEKAPGRFGALDGKAFFAWKMAAGAQYHLALSNELGDLGLATVEVGKNGIFEIAGVDKALKRYFSARREVIVEELEQSGVVSGQAPALAAAVARATRRVKTVEEHDQRFAQWRESATDFGFDPARLQGACEEAGRSQLKALHPAEVDALIAMRIAGVLRELTDHQSTFERQHLHAAVATALIGTGQRAERVEQEIQALLAKQTVVALDSDVWGHEVMTTPEMLAIERQIGVMAQSLGLSGLDAPDAAHVETLIAARGLNGEQAAAVQAATRGDAITIIEGAPGSGKTTTLGPIKEAWEAAGYRVIGSATAWKIAHMLRDELNLDARATDSWLTGAAHGQPFLDNKTVLILDEAGLLSSRQMHAVLTAFKAARTRHDRDPSGPGQYSGALDSPRLILLGDRKQLRSVGAGAGLQLLAASLPVQGVDTIQRQREAWARDAIRAFGNGEAADALTAFGERDLVRERDGARATVRALVDAWSAVSDLRVDAETLLIAKTNAQVNAISAEVRSRLRQSGQIKGEESTIEAVTPSGHGIRLGLAEGDRVRFLTRARLGAMEVINGTEATIERIAVDDAASVRIIARVGDRRLSFNPAEIADDHGRAQLAHAYATTIHGAQGLTTTNAFVIMGPEMDRHDIYVAASRARETTTLFVDRKALDARLVADVPLAQRRTHLITDEARQSYLAKQLGRSGVKKTTLDVLMAAREREKAAVGTVPATAEDTKALGTKRARRRSQAIGLD